VKNEVAEEEVEEYLFRQ